MPEGAALSHSLLGPTAAGPALLPILRRICTSRGVCRFGSYTSRSIHAAAAHRSGITRIDS